MRKIYLLFIVCIWMLASCERDHIGVYHDNDYIQFTKYLIDSTTCSFLAYPTATGLRFPVAVEVIGMPSQQDREYKVEVLDSYTTAPAENYSLPTTFTMKAGAVVDTCWVVFKKTNEISVEAKRLTLQLTETTHFKLGQADCRANIIYVSNVIAKPDWWTSSVTSSYLGEYSDKKYRLFIQETGKAEVNSSDANEMRYYAIIFKNYLLKEKDADRMVTEDDGTEMTVTLIGG